MKKEINGIALHAEKIAKIYKEVNGREITPEDLRELLTILVVESLADLSIIARPVLSQSNLYRETFQRLKPFCQNPDIRREGEGICSQFCQNGRYPAIPSIFSHLRDSLWRLDYYSVREKIGGGTRRLKKNLGIYETPIFLADFLYLIIQHFAKEITSVLDPASGSGNLLAPFYKSQTVTDIYAIETDGTGLLLADISRLATTQELLAKNLDFHAILGDFLSLSLPQKVDVVVSNPPWGLPPSSLQHYDKVNFPAGYKNQADSWALFLDKSGQILHQDQGILAFIIPNTLCLNPNFEDIRRYLLQSFSILLILNLGEGIFPLVTQPAMLLVARKIPAPQNHMISVNIFQNSERFESRAMRLSTWLPRTIEELVIFLESCKSFNQNSFLTGLGSRLEIFSQPAETLLIQKISSACPYEFGDFVANSRGVEIGKRAEVIQCPECGRWNPPPQWNQDQAGKYSVCNHCKTKIKEQPSLKKVNIIEHPTIPYKNLAPNIMEILVGEQISKFHIKDHYYIRTDLDGINYKPNRIYQSPKILVRKTGREINAAIDWEDRMTVQVVYIFQLKSGVPYKIPIEVLLCLLNSRFILFYYYHRFGDPEKRNYAHYIQSHLKNLPLPDLKADTNKDLCQIKEIIMKYPKFGQEGIKSEDQRILDAAIENLYGLLPSESELVRKWRDHF